MYNTYLTGICFTSTSIRVLRDLNLMATAAQPAASSHPQLHESHGYWARESMLHVPAEMIEWLDRYVKNKE